MPQTVVVWRTTITNDPRAERAASYLTGRLSGWAWVSRRSSRWPTLVGDRGRRLGGHRAGRRERGRRLRRERARGRRDRLQLLLHVGADLVEVRVEVLVDLVDAIVELGVEVVAGDQEHDRHADQHDRARDHEHPGLHATRAAEAPHAVRALRAGGPRDTSALRTHALAGCADCSLHPPSVGPRRA